MYHASSQNHQILKTPIESALASLNPAQKEAATHIDGAMLILAGAGSGKTKTLTTRLAYLIEEVGIPSHATLTLTFTNKAAQEMRERAMGLLRIAQTPPLLCTFHKFGLLFLRFHIAELGRNANFVVIDSDDKRAILKSLSKRLSAADYDSYISHMKNAYLSPLEARAHAHSDEWKHKNAVYEEYEAFLREKNLLDFDDLLYLTYKILLEREDIAKSLSVRYQYIMVDEYQDTNEIQYKILKRLCLTHQNLCVVGDDDQSIYGWRGAMVQNILNFPKEFEQVKIIKLEQNYRSSEEILNAANTLIAHNSGRLGKVLQSTKGSGAAVNVREFYDEGEEAQYIARDIARLLSEGVLPSHIAILFRVNALSRSIEEGLNRAKIPYKLIGAMRFYERAEIKDLLCYLRLIVNPRDDYSFLRIINRPKRGIGKVTQARLEELSSKHNRACLEMIELEPQACIASIGQKAYNELAKLLKSLNQWRECEDLADLIDSLEEELNFEFSKLDEVDRQGNIDEFYGMFRDYAIHNPGNRLEDFLNDLALASPTDEEVGEAISCMSVHAAKGLEFKHVYIMGFENGFFPLVRGEGDEIEEERRLGYVAFTRAKDFLNISSVKSRFYRGKREFFKKSQFIKEAGLENPESSLIDSENLSCFDTEHSSSQSGVELGASKGVDSKNHRGFVKGAKVRHKLFGVGIILHARPSGKDYHLTINFAGLERVIISSFVQLCDE